MPRCCSSPPRRPAGARPLPAGRARGVALHESFGSIVAQVVEASVDGGKPRVHRVVCAVDCGIVVNPGIVAQQMESAVIFGLSAALHGRIDIEAGVVQQTQLPRPAAAARWRDSPAIETHLVPSTRAAGRRRRAGHAAGGAGARQALFALTGQRLRELPLKLSRLSSRG